MIDDCVNLNITRVVHYQKGNLNGAVVVMMEENTQLTFHVQ